VEATAFGASLGDVWPDVGDLDEETQRFVLETHLENIGLMDFLGFELASLASQYSDYSQLPPLGGGGSASAPAGRSEGGKMGDVGAFVTTIKSFVGMGILTLPYAATKGGYILGPALLLFIAWLSHHCMGLLLKLSGSGATKTTSFGALGMQICGRWAKVAVEIAILLTQAGFAIADLIFIVENVRDVVCLETQGTACPTKVTMCIGTLMCLVPLSWLRSLQVLTVPVLMSNAALLCGISWVYYCSFAQIGASGVGPGLVAFNWEELPVFFGCAVFSFEGIGLVMPIQAAMQHPSHLPRILRQAMLILATLFSSFSIVGYLAYGSETSDMVVFSIPQNKITSFLRLFYCMGVFFTYPVMLFPVYGVTESKLRCLRNAHRPWRRIVFRTVLVVLTGVVGMQIPHFGLFLGLIGSVACSLLAFVLPALFHMKRPDRSDATTLGDVKDAGLMAFGLIGGGVSFCITLKALMSSPSEEAGG